MTSLPRTPGGGTTSGRGRAREFFFFVPGSSCGIMFQGSQLSWGFARRNFHPLIYQVIRGILQDTFFGGRTIDRRSCPVNGLSHGARFIHRRGRHSIRTKGFSRSVRCFLGHFEIRYQDKFVGGGSLSL